MRTGRKNRDRAPFHSADDSRIVVNDFRLRGQDLFVNYRTVEYSLYPGLEESVMLPRLEDHLNKLFAGELDSGNGDVLDAIIFDPARRALPDLCRQRVNHEDMLTCFGVRRKADVEDVTRLLEAVQKEKEEAERAYEEICSLIAAQERKGGRHEI